MVFLSVVGLDRPTDLPGPLFRQLSEVDFLGAGEKGKHQRQGNHRIHQARQFDSIRKREYQHQPAEKHCQDRDNQQKGSG